MTWRWLSAELAKLQSVHRLRHTSVLPEQGISFTSNDYLGLAEQSRSLSFEQRTSASASRVAGGTAVEHLELEDALAEWLQQEASLVCGAGYLANIAAVTSLVSRNDVVFADRFCHASIIDGILLSRAKHIRFRHNDLNDLEASLQQRSRTRRAGERWVTLVESVYSMDGDLAPLSELSALSRRYESILMVDEAHAVGVFGPFGSGLASELGLAVDVVTGSCSKALGSVGGFIACSKELRSYIVSTGRAFIFNSALPPLNVQITSSNLSRIRRGEVIGSELLERSRSFAEQLIQRGVAIVPSGSQIQPLIVGEESQALLFAERLRERGVLVSAIRPPTVPLGTARLRFSLRLPIELQTLHAVADIVAEAAVLS